MSGLAGGGGGGGEQRELASRNLDLREFIGIDQHKQDSSILLLRAPQTYTGAIVKSRDSIICEIPLKESPELFLKLMSCDG